MLENPRETVWAESQSNYRPHGCGGFWGRAGAYDQRHPIADFLHVQTVDSSREIKWEIPVL